MGLIEDIESYTVKNIIQTYFFVRNSFFFFLYVVIKTIIMRFCIETYEIKHNLINENEYYY